MYGFIYITTNNQNGKRYLGMCSYHRSNYTTYLGSGKALFRAIKKYGKESFTREILLQCETKQELSEKEKEYIKLFDCVKDPNWYNIAEGGYTTRGFSGKKHTEETKAKMRANHKQPLTEDSRRRMSESNKRRFTGIKLSEEHRRKIGLIRKGKKHTEEAKAKMSEYRKNKPKSVCPHCDKIVDSLNYKRWHGDNCKLSQKVE